MRVMSRDCPEILVVGAGIQGLMTASALRDSGARVTVLSAGCDPRTAGDPRSATAGGEAGRFVTPLEGHPYLGDSPFYPDMANALARTVTQGGWLGRSLKDYPSADRAWLRARATANADTAGIVATADWFARSSVDSMARWRRLADQRLGLFEGTSLTPHDGVLCLYDRLDLARQAAAVHARLDTLREMLGPDALAELSPTFAPACRSGDIGGAIRVAGYSFDVKRFVTNLIVDLKAAGVRFEWDTECLGVEHDGCGNVRGLRLRDGVRSADHYVLHPGAYGNAAFADDLGVPLAGVAGRWLLVPRPPGFDCPVKAHVSPRTTDAGDHAVIDVNLTPYHDAVRGGDYLAIGGGYLFVGHFPFGFDEVEMRALDNELEHAARRLMPDWMSQCESDGRIVRSDATCVRAFTPDDRPAVIHRPTARGGHLLLHNGLNTGATALAPFIAKGIATTILNDDTSAWATLSPETPLSPAGQRNGRSHPSMRLRAIRA